MDIKVDADFDVEVKEEIECKPTVESSSSDDDVVFVRRDKILPECFIVNKTEIDSDDDCLIVDNLNVARPENNATKDKHQNGENVSSLLKKLLNENSPEELSTTTSQLKRLISESPRKSQKHETALQAQKTLSQETNKTPPQKKVIEFTTQKNNSPKKLTTSSQFKGLIGSKSPKKSGKQETASKAQKTLSKETNKTLPQKKIIEFTTQKNTNKNKTVNSPEVSLIPLNPQTSNNIWTSLSKHLQNSAKRLKKRKTDEPEVEKKAVAMVAPQKRKQAPKNRNTNKEKKVPKPRKKTKLEEINSSLSELRNEIAELRNLLKEKK